jgi:hypothetical protein
MTKLAAFLLAFSLTAAAALAASPEAAYLAARDKAIAEIKRLEASKASDETVQAAEDKASDDLARRLREIIGPVALKGFSGSGKLNIESLSEGDVGFGMLDGLAFDAKGDSVVVTTRPLLAAWLAAKAREADAESRLPADIAAAVKQEDFYTFAISPDAAFAANADLPVTRPAGADLAVATLGEFEQDIGHDNVDQIVAAVAKGDRVLVASIQRKAPIAKIAACEKIWTDALARSDKLQAEYRASGLKDEKLFDESNRVEEEGDKDYRACFNQRAPREPFFAGLVKEAQDLVDRLAGG